MSCFKIDIVEFMGVNGMQKTNYDSVELFILTVSYINVIYSIGMSIIY